MNEAGISQRRAVHAVPIGLAFALPAAAASTFVLWRYPMLAMNVEPFPGAIMFAAYAATVLLFLLALKLRRFNRVALAALVLFSSFLLFQPTKEIMMRFGWTHIDGYTETVIGGKKPYQ